jgi:hypothetical protein
MDLAAAPRDHRAEATGLLAVTQDRLANKRPNRATVVDDLRGGWQSRPVRRRDLSIYGRSKLDPELVTGVLGGRFWNLRVKESVSRRGLHIVKSQRNRKECS